MTCLSPLAESTSAVKGAGTGHKEAEIAGICSEKAIPVFPVASPSQCEVFCLSASAAWFHPLSAQDQLSEDYVETNKEGQRDKIFFKLRFSFIFH